jgi:hypothetical protein
MEINFGTTLQQSVMKIRPEEADLLHVDGRTDRQTDSQDEGKSLSQCRALTNCGALSQCCTLSQCWKLLQCCEL